MQSIINWVVTDEWHWHLNQKINIDIWENAFGNVVYKISAISFSSQCDRGGQKYDDNTYVNKTHSAHFICVTNQA